MTHPFPKSAESKPGDPSMALGVAGFVYADLYDPARLRELYDAFDRWFCAEDPAAHATFAAYRACKGAGMAATARSEAILAAAPWVGRFVGKLFGVEKELEGFRETVRRNDPLWRFRKDFAKKRVLREGAGKSWTRSRDEAAAVARAALQSMTPVPIAATTDEERTIATAALPLIEADEVARKAAKAGGAEWTDELRARVRKMLAAVVADASAATAAIGGDGRRRRRSACACRGVRTRRDRGVARREACRRARLGAAVDDAAHSEVARLRPPRRNGAAGGERAGALRRPGARAAAKDGVLADRPAHEAARGRSRDRLLHAVP
jgi:hypothetical protein